ncbi:hypothetical protein GOP47_0021193 [Adiantum capillus-veneris]|uniref:Uncharacterized protein n=1 Tax=Adiantum capillus-veneris TaxID=13818 RepID=A0A9D4Z6V6_ADICA|nr:hypothetical protein GOP47_0021193 [Adiantum capillus-veneris]
MKQEFGPMFKGDENPDHWIPLWPIYHLFLMQFIYLCYIILSYAVLFYLNNIVVEHECSMRGWAMMVHPNLVPPWTCQKLVHGELEADGFTIKAIPDEVLKKVQLGYVCSMGHVAGQGWISTLLIGMLKVIED